MVLFGVFMLLTGVTNDPAGINTTFNKQTTMLFTVWHT